MSNTSPFLNWPEFVLFHYNRFMYYRDIEFSKMFKNLSSKVSPRIPEPLSDQISCPFNFIVYKDHIEYRIRKGYEDVDPFQIDFSRYDWDAERYF